TFTIANQSVTEGGSLIFTVTLSNAVQGGVNVAYNSADGSATVADSDYTAASGTLSFTGTAGEQRNITVATTADTKVEANETFSVRLGPITPQHAGVSGSNYSTVGNPATGTTRRSADPTFTIANQSVTEGGSLIFTVTLSNAVQGGVNVAYSSADGSATV